MEKISIPSLFDETFFYKLSFSDQIFQYANFNVFMFSFYLRYQQNFKYRKLYRHHLIKKILRISKGIDEDTLHYRLNQLGEKGTRKLNELLFKKYSQLLSISGLSTITIDIDSTVEMTYGNQEGATKGYNPYHKGANSYHPNIAFCAQTKQIIGSWFRTGSAYTSNGTDELINQITSNLPSSIKEILFCMDCGYFSNKIIFTIEDKAINIYRLYNKRGECKNWIENLKHQFHGCHTITNNFWTNDIIWQLATLAYNISVSFRLNLGREVWRE